MYIRYTHPTPQHFAACVCVCFDWSFKRWRGYASKGMEKQMSNYSAALPHQLGPQRANLTWEEFVCLSPSAGHPTLSSCPSCRGDSVVMERACRVAKGGGWGGGYVMLDWGQLRGRLQPGCWVEGSDNQHNYRRSKQRFYWQTLLHVNRCIEHLPFRSFSPA